MNKVTASAGLALALALAACGDGAADRNTTNIQVPEGDYQQQLQTMSDVERNGVFFRAIRDAGRDCSDIQGSTPGGELQGRPTWTARCNNGVDWLIIVGRDGFVQVVSREEAEAMNLGGGNQAGTMTGGNAMGGNMSGNMGTGTGNMGAEPIMGSGNMSGAGNAAAPIGGVGDDAAFSNPALNQSR